MKQLLILFCLLLCTTPASSEDLNSIRECISCHIDMASFRGNGEADLKGKSHHVQGVPLSGKHCYACHWEATADGRINKKYHQDRNGKDYKPTVHLVVWKEGKRPIAYKPYSTAVLFQPWKISTVEERKEVATITIHCLGCHSDGSNGTLPFAGDKNEPRTYAWDGQSIASRYSQKGITAWGKYSTANSNKKQRVVKSFSAHGNAAANFGGWDTLAGYDGDMPASRGGAAARNVECFDCHNSHGSSITGVTSSYRTADGSFGGGILKETVSGMSGYAMTYTPSINTHSHSKNPFNAGAGLCFDCHETATAGSTPWGYSTTFGARQPIMGYKDSLGFGPGNKGSSSRFSNRQSRETIASSHLKAGKPLSQAVQGQINGLCTPCHDPHGISKTLGERMQYAVPLLKGTWLTSPYREDGPPAALLRKGNGDSGAPRQDDYNAVNRQASANFGKGESSAPRDAEYNEVNRDAGANFGKGDSGAPRQDDYNAVNRQASANFGKGESSAPRDADYNEVNRDAGANFGKGDSGAPRQDDYNAVNRQASANFGKGESAARDADYNEVNRDAGANFGKGDSGAPRQDDYNVVNRQASANFGKGDSTAPRDADYNEVNREAGANFGKGDFNKTNRDGNANFGKGSSGAPREIDANATNRDFGSNFGRSSSSAPREPMKGMKYNVDRNTFDGKNRITENEDSFGGICLKCHPKETLKGGSKTGLVHSAVKGWGDNGEHSFPCSKCHQAHNSGLPKLMQTNCFEQGPSGLRENSGLAWLPYKKTEKNPQGDRQQAAAHTTSTKSKIVGCHVKQFGKSTTTSSENSGTNQWKELTPW